VEINVAQLLKAPIGTTRDYEVDEVADIDDGGYPVKGKVQLTRTNRGILVKGTINIEIKITCSRCLDEFNCPLTLKIEEEYFPSIDVVTGAPVALPDEPGSFTINERHILDLTEAIRQYAIMATPMKPLCRQDCAGLCPTCGYDLNRGSCGCLPQVSQGSTLEERLPARIRSKRRTRAS
jgi:uncharacterized protein